MRYPVLLLAAFLIWSSHSIAAEPQAGSSCWTVQLGAFSEIANATRRLDSLNDPQCRVLSDSGHHRIQCGCFNTHDLAGQSIAQWQAIDSGVFVISAPATVLIEPNKNPTPVAVYPSNVATQLDLEESGFDSGIGTPHVEVASAAINPRGIEYLDQDPSAEQSEFTQLSGVEKARVLRRRPYERIPETELAVELFGRLLTIGGELSLETEERKDFAFGTEADDLERETVELELEFFYPFSDYSAAFVELEGVRKSNREPELDQSDTESRWTRSEMWFYTGGWLEDTVGIQAGRQNFADDRSWWWDKNLDAVRVHYDTETLHMEVGIAQELARASTDEDRIDPEEDEVLRVISSATWVWDTDHRASIFVLIQRDGSDTEAAGEIVKRDLRDKSDLDAVWIGGRRQGKYRLEKLGRLYYWIDVGLVAGTEKIIDYDTIDPQFSRVDSVDRRDLRAAGLDLGGMWKTKLMGGMTFSLAYAVGSGDSDPGDDTDRAYRQTGLNRNDDKFRGVNNFHYYGDLLRPELSNISITTLGWGFHFLPESSIDLIYHSYQQQEASDEISGSRLDIDPQGDNREIGSELDLIVGIEEWKKLELELVISRFKAGDAFGSLKGETASKWSLELSYRF